ncbi:MAG: selenocysteine synthase, partial [Chloroflexota bacterium]|nr:selenocysteine synthase [Chloroflexota bacterium]
MDIYKELNIKTIINAQSWVTKLGGSIMRPEVLDAMNKASSAFVNVEELHEKCSEQIANLCNSESALITSGCASAIVLMSAAVICAKDESLIDEIPNIINRPEILIDSNA